MQAAIYCRVSTNNQEREGTSLVSQYEACLSKAKELELEVLDDYDYIFREVRTGADFDRPLLNQVRDLIKTEAIQALICYATDRLARNPIHIAIIAEECQKHKVNLIFVSEPLDTSPEGQLIQYVKGYAAQIEREKIKDRSRRGMQTRAKLGKMPTGRGVLYGYNYDKATGQNVANKCLDNVRMAGLWLINEGISLNEVCRRLMDMGIPAPKGGTAWSRGTIGRIFRNSTYAGKTYAYKTKTLDEKGKRRANNDNLIEIPDAVDKPAFTWEEWEAIQNQLKKNREQSTRIRKFNYLLRSMVYCKQDGAKYYGVPIHGIPYYRCSINHSIVPGVKCQNRSYNAGQLEALVWDKISSLLKQPELVFNEVSKEILPEVEVKSLQDQVTLHQKRLDELDELNTRYGRTYAYGIWDEDKLLKEDAKLKKEQAKLNETIAELSTRIERTKQAEWNVEKIQEVCRAIGKAIDNCSFEDKRLALEGLAIKVWIDGSSVEIEGIIPVSDMSHASQPS